MKFCVFLVTLLGLWVLLVWPFPLATHVPDLVAGAIVALILTVFLRHLYREAPKRLFSPKRWLCLLLYLPYFFYYCLRANLDVAYRVLHPDVPIHPGIVKVRTDLQTDIAKTFLANSITLTPGTLTVDIIGQDFYVHWINIKSDDVEEQTKEIIKRFEWLLKEIFE